MKKIYGKLAWTNMKNNMQLYLPYLLTGMISVIMFYTMVALYYNSGVRQIPGVSNLLNFLALGEWVIGIFVTIFLFYTNSFIMKRRKKELGIYNILGMEKKHIARVLFLETGIMAFIVIAGGLLLGIMFNKLIIMILYRIIHFSSSVQFEISGQGMKLTILLFAIIFAMTICYNLLQVKLANPIQLLSGGNVGEKEPKTKILMTILGVISLGIGYYISLSTKSPLSAITMFFVAVIFVIIGTYLLFTAGSIALLKLLRKNKNYYYKTSHFTAVSGMLYRMKQNAVGLANICILSTMVLVIISCTVSMFAGVDDELKTRFPAEISIRATTEEIMSCEEIMDAAKEAVKESGRTLLDEQKYFELTVITLLEDGKFVGREYLTEESVDYSKIQSLTFVTPDSAKEIVQEEIPSLQKGEVIMYGIPVYEGDTLSVLGKEYKIAASKKLDSEEESYMLLGGTYYVVLSDETELDAVYQLQKEMYGDKAGNYMYHCYLDIDGTSEEKISCYQLVRERIKEFSPDAGERGAMISMDSKYTNKNYTEIYSESRSSNKDEFFIMYGGFFFLGIFLGIMFLMVTALIIYFKQISEGYDDKERFIIMQKVGMGKKEVKASIASQVRTVFLLPIVAAAIHVAFAYPIVIKLLALLNLTNANLFRLCLVGTILVFTVVYYLVFKCTSRTYCRIVGK